MPVRRQHLVLHAEIVAQFVAGLGLVLCPLAQAFGGAETALLVCRSNGASPPNHNTELCGPAFSYVETVDTVWCAIHPVLSFCVDRGTDSAEFDFLYPLLTYRRHGDEYTVQMCQLIRASGGSVAAKTNYHRFTVFPILFTQCGPDPAQSYSAIFPVGGRLRNRLFREEIEFVLWPAYVKTVRASRIGGTSSPQTDLPPVIGPMPTAGKTVTYNFFAPIFHVRSGNGLKGWQVWPFIGHEEKTLTACTNAWGEIETFPGYKSQFVLWPIYLRQTRNIGTTNVERHSALLPLYAMLRSAQRDSTCYLWPVGVTITDDRAKRYHEVGAPWPFVVFAAGEGKTAKRVFPLFSHARSAVAESEWYLWPLYKRNRLVTEPLERTRTRVLFFLFSDTTEKNTQTDRARRQTYLWPVLSMARSFDGAERFQSLSILEPFLPNNTGIERNYSPVWALWRMERNPAAGLTNHSFLWNLYRYKADTNGSGFSFLFGLLKYQSDAQQKCLRIFNIPLTKRSKPVFAPLPNAGTNDSAHSRRSTNALAQLN